jgi:putative ABC transport system substrate-binding protein
LVPKAARIAVLINPANPASMSTLQDLPDAARAMGLQIQVLYASTTSEIETAFATLVRERADALYVAGDVFFTSRRVQFATLAASYRMPACYPSREAVEALPRAKYGWGDRYLVDLDYCCFPLNAQQCVVRITSKS